MNKHELVHSAAGLSKFMLVITESPIGNHFILQLFGANANNGLKSWIYEAFTGIHATFMAVSSG